MIDYINKDLFWESSVPKDITITFSDGDTITNSDIESEKFSIIEAINSGNELDFGSSNSSEVSFTIHNVYRSKVGCTMTIDLVINEDTENVFRIGTYKVFSDVPTADRTKREIKAYDALCDIINADLTPWYNTLLPNNSSTVTLATMRSSLASHFGLLQETQTLVNDNMTIRRTITPTTLSGNDVLHAIGQINGAFPHITREGKLKYINLDQGIEGLYPSLTLYPSEDLFPRASTGSYISQARYMPPLKYEDYMVQSITGVSIRNQSGEIATTVGTTENPYIVANNFLCFGKSASELTTIGNNLLSKIAGISYKPYSVKSMGNPCFEVGDVVRLNTNTSRVESYILYRRLVGVQHLVDEYTSDGLEKRTERVNSIASKFSSLESGIQASISEVRNGLELKVSKDSVVSAINLSPEQITISSSKIKLEGYTTINGGFAVDLQGNVSLNNVALHNIYNNGGDTLEIQLTGNGVLTSGTISGNLFQSFLGVNGLRTSSDEYSARYNNSYMQLSGSSGAYFYVSDTTFAYKGHQVLLDNSTISTSQLTGYISADRITGNITATYADIAGGLANGTTIGTLRQPNGQGVYSNKSIYWKQLQNIEPTDFVVCAQ